MTFFFLAGRIGDDWIRELKWRIKITGLIKEYEDGLLWVQNSLKRRSLTLWKARKDCKDFNRKLEPDIGNSLSRIFSVSYRLIRKQIIWFKLGKAERCCAFSLRRVFKEAQFFKNNWPQLFFVKKTLRENELKQLDVPLLLIQEYLILDKD